MVKSRVEKTDGGVIIHPPKTNPEPTSAHEAFKAADGEALQRKQAGNDAMARRAGQTNHGPDGFGQ